jgi:hypothetical protein
MTDSQSLKGQDGFRDLIALSPEFGQDVPEVHVPFKHRNRS